MKNTNEQKKIFDKADQLLNELYANDIPNIAKTAIYRDIADTNIIDADEIDADRLKKWITAHYKIEEL